MNIDATETSSLTSKADLTEIHTQSGLSVVHQSLRTKSDLLIGEGRTSGYLPTKPSKRKPSSWIWKHGEPITRESDGQNLWLCRICFNTTTKGLKTCAADPTTHAARHLTKHHYFDNQGVYIGKSSVPAKRQNVLEQIEQQNKAQNTSFDRAGFEGVYTTWLIEDNLSLRQATSQRLRELITVRDPFVENVLPKNHHTVSSWIKKYYSVRKQFVRNSLLEAVSKITISFDGWTSASNMDLLGVMAHYIDSSYCH